MSDVHHYFAFGSNMNPARVRERGLRVRRVRGASLHGYSLVFDKRSADHPRSGHANVVWDRGGIVEGVLYELADGDEIRHMDPFERAPVNYSRDVVGVVVAEGPEQVLVPAWTYFANAAVRVTGARPEAAYMAHLLAGAPFLSDAYVARLRAWPLAGDDPS
ncbi:MAG TPA: gamma-glutamylcyclotransferase family protein [Pseudomonadales bacterium]|nr:gamma-glutamylcyclotransferase family protein [Pseudomonadales bacterium]